MPIFEYRCEDCGHRFEAILFGEQKPECPKCHTARLEQQLHLRRQQEQRCYRAICELRAIELLHDQRRL
jgi:putative FmdB family regulatory protein